MRQVLEIWCDSDGTLWIGFDAGFGGYRMHTDGTPVVSIADRLAIYRVANEA